MRVGLIVLAVLCLSTAAGAQTNIRVLGVGKVGFDVAAPVLDAQAQAYKGYMPAANATAISLTVTCATQSGTTDALCTFPLSELPLTATFQTLAVTSSVTAPDGTVESAKVSAPFALALVGPPVPPKATGMSVRPASP